MVTIGMNVAMNGYDFTREGGGGSGVKGKPSFY